MKVKTTEEILEDIKAEICDTRCKYSESWDEEAEGCELAESDVCKNCPVGKLI